MLTISDLHVHYEAIHALKGVSLTVGSGEMVAIIGANGAGKTTLLRTISGLLKASRGSIHYNDTELTKLRPHQIVQRRLVQVPEGRLIFPDMTVRENLELGSTQRRDRTKLSADYDFVFSLFPRLRERRAQYAGTLSGGEQQMLAIGRALMGKPQLLLLDEPSLGIAPLLVQQIFACLKSINERDTSLLLVEQDSFLALKFCQRAYVLETGQIVLEGECEKLRHHERVKQAYLGG